MPVSFISSVLSASRIRSGGAAHKFRILPALMLCSMAMAAAPASPAQASTQMRERWTLATMAGTATLALIRDPGAQPVIMFVCGANLQGVAQVIVPHPEVDFGDLRLRLDLEAGDASVMAAASRLTGVISPKTAVTSHISTQDMASLMVARAAILSWRVDVSHSFAQPQTRVALPHPVSRHRADFLRYCI